MQNPGVKTLIPLVKIAKNTLFCLLLATRTSPPPPLIKKIFLINMESNISRNCIYIFFLSPISLKHTSNYFFQIKTGVIITKI